MLDLERGALLALDLPAVKALLTARLEPGEPSAADLGDDARPGGELVQRTLRLAVPRPTVVDLRARRGDDGSLILYLRDQTAESEVDRMKSEFLSAAAHELRTPMVSIFGFTELLLNRPVGDDRRRDVLQTIHRQAKLLIGIVNELLDLARIEARQGKDLHREPQRLGDLVARAVDGVAGGDARGRFVADMTHADTTLLVDPAKTEQALVNVLSNAVKYAPDGGPIRLSTRIGRVQHAPAVGVSVQDRGIGMSPEQLGRVFERFYRADPSGNIPGTGLGMSLVKEIVELQGGRVQVDSELGCGTTVTLWLPLALQAAVAAPPQA
jgi:signal transduction histidine kinase